MRTKNQHPPTSPSIAMATQSDLDWSAPHVINFFQCTATINTLQPHRILRLPKKNELHHILHLPQQVDIMIDPNHISISFTMPRGSKQNPPTSPENVHAKKLPKIQNKCGKKLQHHFPCANNPREHPTKIHWADTKLNSPCRLVFYTRPQQALLKFLKFPGRLPLFLTAPCACQRQMDLTKCCAASKNIFHYSSTTL